MAGADLKSLTQRKPRKKKESEASIDLLRLEESSESELVVLAHEVGYPTASRVLRGPELIQLILGEREPPPDPIEEMRKQVYDYVSTNTALMHSYMACDFNCLQCPTTWVVECYTENKDDHLKEP